MININGILFIKIGVFYDGNYFYYVSNFYNYVYECKIWISIKGLYEFICYKVVEFEGDGINVNYC